MNCLNCPLYKKFIAKLEAKGELDRKLRKVGITDRDVRRKILAYYEKKAEK